MKNLLLCLACVLGLTQAAWADIIYTVVPDSIDTFVAGQQATFNVYVRSTEATGNQVVTLDVNAIAGAGDGSGGVFASGTTLLLNAQPFDVTTTPGQAFSTNFLANPATIPFADGVGPNLGVLHGILVLDTTGVAPGTYDLTMDQLDATPFWDGLGSPPPALASLGVFTTYTIVAVPEPTSLALIGMAGAAVVHRIRRRKAQPSRTL